MKNQAAYNWKSLVLMLTIAQIISLNSGICQTNRGSSDSTGQSQPSVSCLGLSFGMGNHASMGLSFDILGKLQESRNACIGVRLAYKGYLFRSLNMPDDYEPGWFGIPRDGISMLTALFAVETRVIEDTYFGFMIGPAYNSIREITYTPDASRIWGESNYDHLSNRIQELGVILEIKIKSRSSDRFGLELSGYVNANTYKPMVGLCVGFIFGNI